MKTVVHANRLKPFNESANAQREEIVDERDYSEEADTPEDSTNKQSDSDANDHTINRQVNSSPRLGLTMLYFGKGIKLPCVLRTVERWSSQ